MTVCTAVCAACKRPCTRSCTYTRPCLQPVYAYTDRIHGMYRPYTRSVHDRVQAVYRVVNTIVYSLWTRPHTVQYTATYIGVHGCVQRHAHGRVHSRVLDRTRSCRQPCLVEVYTYSRPVYTARSRPCIRPCTRSCSRQWTQPVCGRVHGGVHGRVHEPCLRPRTGRVHGRVHRYRVHGSYMAVNTSCTVVYTAMYTAVCTAVYTAVYSTDTR